MQNVGRFKRSTSRMAMFNARFLYLMHVPSINVFCQFGLGVALIPVVHWQVLSQWVIADIGMNDKISRE